MKTLSKKYGIWTSMAMVIGVVIGSGIFFKADDVLALTNGNLPLALLAWTIGALSMIFGTFVFAEFARRIQFENGIVDYSEHAYGKRFGYLVGWFNWTLYYTPLSAILAWVSSLYTLLFFGSKHPDNSLVTWVVAFGFITILYFLNYYKPLFSGKLQVTATIIKLIPLLSIAIGGILFAFNHHLLSLNWSYQANPVPFTSFSGAVVSCAFAFEGWIVATTINNEIFDSKHVLPKALIFGSLVIFAVYITYFLGLNGVLPSQTIILLGNNSVNQVATQLFGLYTAKFLTLFVVVSCLGTLNGLVISCIRTPHSLALRNQGIKPLLLAYINPHTTMPPYSSLYSYGLSILYLFIWYGSLNNWFGQYIGLDEIPIVMIYGIYLLLYVWYMIEFKQLNFLKRFGVPFLAILGSLVILYGGITNPSIGIYLILSLFILIIGLLFYKQNPNIKNEL